MRYRPPRVGDILAVRSTDPHLDEASVLIHTVADTGDYLLLAGRWGKHDLEIVLRRVGDHHLQNQE
jgi:hypothetical protein